MWLNGFAVLQNLHTAKSGETLCTSEAGDALSLPQFPGELFSPFHCRMLLFWRVQYIPWKTAMSALTAPIGFPIPIKRDLN